ncbi:hypothetical protein CROQUDRAFT_674754 [Cronartium quercuum f. sp. fusiforme G11]|uniref:C2H2-type domain-containing protein n=1 Tax=Cronartium quercuum f. sp. fusiforme G11 TaxID=708437 RepID=A0A9P6N9Q7_9BASI|nr:hypothetical protein CROQUDRAFT_674754 [Cronartium quercuum f. sp. fusiforme G11]
MVHCPLQTNVCGICEKTFKRSYDLRKHEITHTAEHHQAHGRSRAVIYKDLQLPFSTKAELQLAFATRNEAYPTAKSSRAYTLPRGRSSEALNLVAPSTYPRRVNSISSTRSTPYERPRVEKAPLLNRSESNLQLSYTSGFSSSIPPIQQNLASNFSNGPQFQCVDDYSTSSGSPSSRTSNQLVFLDQIAEPSLYTPQQGSDLTGSMSHNQFDFFGSSIHDARRASQPTFLMPEPVNSGYSMPFEMYRTGSLPTNSLYSSVMPNVNLRSNNLSQLLADQQARDNNSLMDFSILNRSSQYPPFDYSFPDLSDPQQHNMWMNNSEVQDNQPFDLLFPASQSQIATGDEVSANDAFGLTPILDQVTQLASTDPNFAQYFANSEMIDSNPDQNPHHELNYVPQYDLFPLEHFS